MNWQSWMNDSDNPVILNLKNVIVKMCSSDKILDKMNCMLISVKMVLQVKYYFLKVLS